MVSNGLETGYWAEMLPIGPPLADPLLVPDANGDASLTACAAYRFHTVTLALPIAALVTGQRSAAPLTGAFGLRRPGRRPRRHL